LDSSPGMSSNRRWAWRATSSALRRLGEKAIRPQAAADQAGQEPPDSAVADARCPWAGSTIGRSRRATARGPRGDPCVADGVDREPAQFGGQGGRVADGGAGEAEGRLGAVVEADPAQPAEQVGDVTAEDPPQGVEFVNHDIAQPHEERRPAVVIREDPGVEASRGWLSTTLAVRRSEARSSTGVSPS